jgi:hypothetical protein
MIFLSLLNCLGIVALFFLTGPDPKIGEQRGPLVLPDTLFERGHGDRDGDGPGYDATTEPIFTIARKEDRLAS